MKRMTLLVLLAAAGCTGSGDAIHEVEDAAYIKSSTAAELIEDIVDDEDRAETAKLAATRTNDTIRGFYANVRVQRDELIAIMGRPGVTKADCQPVIDSLAKLRLQFRERLVDEWLLVRASMTPEEWLEFNTRLQASMDLD